MTAPMEHVEAEATRPIARPAREVWSELVTLKGVAIPNVVDEVSKPVGPGASPHRAGQRIQFSEEAFMEQHVVERDDGRMLLRFEMTAVEGMPIDAYRSAFHIEPDGPAACTVTVRCTARPTTDPAVVQAMLRDLLTLGLEELARWMQSLPEGAGGAESQAGGER